MVAFALVALLAAAWVAEPLADPERTVVDADCAPPPPLVVEVELLAAIEDAEETAAAAVPESEMEELEPDPAMVD